MYIATYIKFQLRTYVHMYLTMYMYVQSTAVYVYTYVCSYADYTSLKLMNKNIAFTC